MNATILPIETVTVEIVKPDLFAYLLLGMAIALIFLLVIKIIKLLKQQRRIHKMDQYYKENTKFIEELEKDFEERVKLAEKTGSFDMTGRSAKLAEVQRKMQESYLEAKGRISKKETKGWFK